MRYLLTIGLCSLFAVACGGSTDDDSPGAAAGGSAGASAGGSSAGGSSAAGAGGSSAGGASAGGAGAGLPTKFGSYIELGDSISDKGGTGPFFYDLLFQNDDAKYPAWAGSDLKSVLGVEQHVHGSKAGAQTIDMPNQVKALPASLPGPVLITITIGGNDMQTNALDIINGKDQNARDRFRTKHQEFLGALKAKDRFGPGVEVYIFEADVYDPTGGKGDFADHNCPGLLSLFPKTPSDSFFGGWNAILVEEVQKLGTVAPLHDTFYQHGIGAGPDTWFSKDCIHPNTPGHHEIRRMFWKTITGKDGPA